MPFGAKNGKFVGPSDYNEADAKKFLAVYEDLVRRSWDDPSFRERLKQHPDEVFAENGLDFGKMSDLGYKFEFDERDFSESSAKIRIPLPKKPDESKLSEEELTAIAGGGSCAGSAGSAATASCPACTASSSGTGGTAC